MLAIPLPADSTGDEYYDDRFSGIPNNAGSGVTGDIDFTTEHPGISPPGDSVSAKPSLLVYKFDNGSINISE